MTAALKGHAEFIRLLLDYGADISLRGADGSDALFLASLNGHTDVVKLLLENGARPDTQEPDGANAPVITASDELVATLRSMLNRDLYAGFAGYRTGNSHGCIFT